MEYRTANEKVIVITKETEDHLAAHPDVLKLLSEAISKIKISTTESRFEVEVNFGKEVGISKLIKIKQVNLDQNTYFAYRKNRQYSSHVVLNSEGKSCSTITLDIRYDKNEDMYTLATAYIGYICPDEPFYFQDRMSSEFKESLEFWSSHALVYDESVMQQSYQSSWEVELSKDARDASVL